MTNFKIENYLVHLDTLSDLEAEKAQREQLLANLDQDIILLQQQLAQLQAQADQEPDIPEIPPTDDDGLPSTKSNLEKAAPWIVAFLAALGIGVAVVVSSDKKGKPMKLD